MNEGSKTSISQSSAYQLSDPSFEDENGAKCNKCPDWTIFSIALLAEIGMFSLYWFNVDANLNSDFIQFSIIKAIISVICIITVISNVLVKCCLRNCQTACSCYRFTSFLNIILAIIVSSNLLFTCHQIQFIAELDKLVEKETHQNSKDLAKTAIVLSMAEIAIIVSSYLIFNCIKFWNNDDNDNYDEKVLGFFTLKFPMSSNYIKIPLIFVLGMFMSKEILKSVEKEINYNNLIPFIVVVAYHFVAAFTKLFFPGICAARDIIMKDLIFTGVDIVIVVITMILFDFFDIPDNFFSNELEDTIYFKVLLHITVFLHILHAFVSSSKMSAYVVVLLHRGYCYKQK